MDIQFQFEVIYNNSDLVEVRVSAWNGAFGGAADVYVGNDQLEEIAAKISGFPTSASDAREITLGAFGPKSGGGVGMRFYCADASGHAFLESRIESDKLSGGTIESVTLSIPIEAVAVDSFVDELRQLVAGKGRKAHLLGLGRVARR